MSEAANIAPESAPVAPVVAVPETPVAAPAQDVDDFDSFHESEIASKKAGSAPAEPKPAEAKPKDEKPAADAKPPEDSALGDKGKAELAKLRRENRELRAKAEAPPQRPPAESAPAKPAEAPAPVEDPEPDPEKYTAEDTLKWMKDHAAWAKREAERIADRKLDEGFSKREAKAKEAQAATEAAAHRERLIEATDAIQEEFPDWSDKVIGTAESEGVAAKLPEQVQQWCDTDPDVSYRGLYELARLPEAEQEAFFKLNNVRKVAKLIALGEKPAEAPKLAAVPGKRAAPPPKTVSGSIGPTADPQDTDDFDTWHAVEQQKKIAARRGGG